MSGYSLENVKNCAGPAEIWTRIAGFRVQSANHYTTGPLALHGEYSLTWLKQKHGIMKLVKNCWPAAMIETSQPLPWPGFEPGLSRPQREVLTTIRSRPSRQLIDSGINTTTDWCQLHIQTLHYPCSYMYTELFSYVTNVCLENSIHKF